jgi:hypothetical protein
VGALNINNIYNEIYKTKSKRRSFARVFIVCCRKRARKEKKRHPGLMDDGNMYGGTRDSHLIHQKISELFGTVLKKLEDIEKKIDDSCKT